MKLPMREKMKAESVERMEDLKLRCDVVQAFWDGKLCCSSWVGIPFEIDTYKESLVKEFEQRYGGMVYHLLETYSDFGTILTMLYVSDNEEEWEMERIGLEDGWVWAFAANLTSLECSESGDVQVEAMNGGLIRVA